MLHIVPVRSQALSKAVQQPALTAVVLPQKYCPVWLEKLRTLTMRAPTTPRCPNCECCDATVVSWAAGDPIAGEC